MPDKHSVATGDHVASFGFLKQWERELEGGTWRQQDQLRDYYSGPEKQCGWGHPKIVAVGKCWGNYVSEHVPALQELRR